MIVNTLTLSSVTFLAQISGTIIGGILNYVMLLSKHNYSRNHTFSWLPTQRLLIVRPNHDVFALISTFWRQPARFVIGGWYSSLEWTEPSRLQQQVRQSTMLDFYTNWCSSPKCYLLGSSRWAPDYSEIRRCLNFRQAPRCSEVAVHTTWSLSVLQSDRSYHSHSTSSTRSSLNSGSNMFRLRYAVAWITAITVLTHVSIARSLPRFAHRRSCENPLLTRWKQYSAWLTVGLNSSILFSMIIGVISQ